MVKFGEPSVVFEFFGVVYLGGSIVVGVLPSGWLFVVVVGCVWFASGIGEVVYVVELVVEVGGGFVWGGV